MKNNKKILIASIVLAVAVVVVAVVVGFDFGSNTGPVAVVNGEEITRQDFNFVKDQLEQTYGVTGQEITSDQLDQSALDQLIATELMLQEAEAQGLSVSEEEIDEQYQSVLDQAGGEEAFKGALEDLEITEDYVRNDIKDQLIIQKYVDSVSASQDFSVTNQEASDYYDQLSQNQEGLPAFSEIEAQITSQLSQQKEGQFISSVVSNLRDNADIEILL